MADNESILLESLIGLSQEEFLKGDSSPDHIVTDSRHQIFSQLAEFQIGGEFCDVVLKSSDNATFKVVFPNIIDIFHKFLIHTLSIVA